MPGRLGAPTLINVMRGGLAKRCSSMHNSICSTLGPSKASCAPLPSSRKSTGGTLAQIKGRQPLVELVAAWRADHAAADDVAPLFHLAQVDRNAFGSRHLLAPGRRFRRSS